MVFTKICPPALIYLIFATTQISVDSIKGQYNTAFIKIFVTFVFTMLLNHLCMSGLGVVSWIIVFIPFLLMTMIVTMLLFVFGLDPSTGKLKIYDSQTATKRRTASKLTHSHSIDSDIPHQSHSGSNHSGSLVNRKTDVKNYREVPLEKINKRQLWNAGSFSNKSNASRQEKISNVVEILKDMGEGDLAASFLNQGGKCINSDTDSEFIECFRTAVLSVHDVLEKKNQRIFLKRIKSRPLISVHILN